MGGSWFSLMDAFLDHGHPDGGPFRKDPGEPQVVRHEILSVQGPGGA
jgi:hypothetical protein